MNYFVGDYAGFDEKEPTSKNGGKAEVISMLKDKYGYTKLIMIGDGITDLEACPPADAFIGRLLKVIVKIFRACEFFLLILKYFYVVQYYFIIIFFWIQFCNIF